MSRPRLSASADTLDEPCAASRPKRNPCNPETPSTAKSYQGHFSPVQQERQPQRDQRLHEQSRRQHARSIQEDRLRTPVLPVDALTGLLLYAHVRGRAGCEWEDTRVPCVESDEWRGLSTVGLRDALRLAWVIQREQKKKHARLGEKVAVGHATQTLIAKCEKAAGAHDGVADAPPPRPTTAERALLERYSGVGRAERRGVQRTPTSQKEYTPEGTAHEDGSDTESEAPPLVVRVEEHAVGIEEFVEMEQYRGELDDRLAKAFVAGNPECQLAAALLCLCSTGRATSKYQKVDEDAVLLVVCALMLLAPGYLYAYQRSRRGTAADGSLRARLRSDPLYGNLTKEELNDAVRCILSDDCSRAVLRLHYKDVDFKEDFMSAQSADPYEARSILGPLLQDYLPRITAMVRVLVSPSVRKLIEGAAQVATVQAGVRSEYEVLQRMLEGGIPASAPEMDWFTLLNTLKEAIIDVGHGAVLHRSLDARIGTTPPWLSKYEPAR